MTRLFDALTRLWARLTGRHGEMRLTEEVESHVAMLADEHERAGLSPRDARAAAMRDFGGVTQLRETYRETRRRAWIDSIWRDVHHGARSLRRTPAFTIAVVLTLALGIGANATIFTLVNALLFRPLPVPNADQLTVFARQRADGETTSMFSFAEFTALRTAAPRWSNVVAVRPATLSLTADQHTDRVDVSFVSENYFNALGLQPSAGAFFAATDPSTSAADPVIVLSYGFWQRRFQGDRSVIGKTVSIAGSPVTIVGVAPRGFTGDSVFRDTSGFLPLHAAGFPMMARTALRVLGFVDSRVTLAQANASLAGLSTSFAQARHEAPERVRLAAFWERYARPNPHAARPEIAMATFFGTLALVVLLLACVNVGNLLLARALARQPEFALRSALGASRGRLARQLFVETLLVVLVASGLGLVFGDWAAHGVGAILPPVLVPFAGQLGFSLDWHVAAFALTAIVVTALIVGTLPAWRMAHAPGHVLRGVSRTSTARRAGLGRILTAAQIAGSLVLLVIAGLFARSLAVMRHGSFGFDERDVVDFSINPAESGYRNPHAEEIADAILARVQALPGVRAAALSQSIPMDDDTLSFGRIFADAPLVNPAHATDDVGYSAISPTYFDMLRIPLQTGRAFSSTDTAQSLRVAIVNRTMADRYWPQGAIGRAFRVNSETAPPVQVIGVVADIKNYGAIQDENPFFYLPIAQHPTPAVIVQVRATTPPSIVFPEVMAQIHAVAPDVTPYRVQTMAEAIEDAPDGLLLFRLGTALATSFGLLGLALAIVGVFGVVAYSASQRTREMAVRLALGATMRDIHREVLRAGGLVIGIGIATGVVLAAIAAMLTANLYVGVRALDPITFTGAVAIVAASALIACDIPARRAMRADPVVALRAE
jgi:predicted permease